MEMQLTSLLLVGGIVLFVYLYRKYQITERRVQERRSVPDRRSRLNSRRLFEVIDETLEERRRGIVDRRVGPFTRRRFLRRAADVDYAVSL
jgi:hypothetical protein